MKTSELTGAALDWAVAKAEGLEFEISEGKTPRIVIFDEEGVDDPRAYAPSTCRFDCESILSLENLTVCFQGWDIKNIGFPIWEATYSLQQNHIKMEGSTPLIAATRAYVAGELGEEVEIPEELVEVQS